MANPKSSKRRGRASDQSPLGKDPAEVIRDLGRKAEQGLKDLIGTPQDNLQYFDGLSSRIWERSWPLLVLLILVLFFLCP